MVKRFYFNQIEKAIRVCLLLRGDGADKKVLMKKSGNDFVTDVKLASGTYYYKFLVNDIMRFNDPQVLKYVLDNRGEVWSQLDISDDTEFALLKGDKPIIREYVLSNCGKGVGPVGRREFFYPRDSVICLSTDIDFTIGLHSISTIWYRGDGMIYCGQEIPVEAFREKDNIKRKFKIRLDNKRVRMGIWKVDVYLDGERIISDYFRLSNKKMMNANSINIQI